MREAVLSDAERISELEGLLFENSMGVRMVRQELRLGRGWVKELSRKESAIAGYILTRRDEDLLDITRLGVHPEAQGRGIGSLLLGQALQGGGTAVLTVQKTNAAALRLYFRHGFEIVGHLHAADAWVLRRAILSPTSA